MLTKDTAICIRATDFSETSQILTLFTRRSGKISVIAKGSKRPKSAFDGPIEVFSSGKIVFSDSTKEKLATLTEFQQQPAFRFLISSCQSKIENRKSKIYSSLFALNCCLFATELLNNLTDDYDPHPKLFDSFLQFLQNTHERRASADRRAVQSIEHRDTLSLLILFQLSLLKEVGLQPILNACANCKTSIEHRLSAVASAKAEASSIEYRVYFSSSSNGLICRDCEASFPDKIRLSNTAANALSNLKLISESDEKTLNEIEKVLIHHFTEILHRPPKMAKYILGTIPSS